MSFGDAEKEASSRAREWEQSGEEKRQGEMGTEEVSGDDGEHAWRRAEKSGRGRGEEGTGEHVGRAGITHMLG